MSEQKETLLTVENMNWVLGYLEQYTVFDVPAITKKLQIMEERIKENADLRAKLAAADFEKARLVRIIEDGNIVRKHIEQERDTELAHSALLVGALENISSIMLKLMNTETKGYSWSDIRDIQYLANISLSTTPSEAYERVQGLVEALEKAMHLLKIYEKCGHIPSGGEEDGNMLCIIETILIAKNALGQYREAIKCD